MKLFFKLKAPKTPPDKINVQEGVRICHRFRTVKIYNFYLYTRPILLRYRDPYRTKTGTVRIAVLNNKRIMVSILVRYGSRSNTKTRTVKINGSVR